MKCARCHAGGDVKFIAGVPFCYWCHEQVIAEALRQATYGDLMRARGLSCATPEDAPMSTETANAVCL